AEVRPAGLGRRPHRLGERRAARTTAIERMRDDSGESERGAVLLHDLDLGVRIGREVVDRDYARLLELADVLDVLVEILEAARDRGRIRCSDVRVLHAAVQLERTYRRDEPRAARR